MFFVTYLASIITHYEPIYKSLSVLVFLLVEVAFVGCVAIGFLQSGSRSDLSLPAFLLPGLFVTAAFAAIWSLFGGLVPWANPALILVVVIVAAVRRRTFANTVREGIRNTRWRSLILFVPCAFFATLNALTNGFCYDNLLYHLAAVRWVADFGSVPGLANLHGRLGFNSALHPLAAFFGAPFGIAIGSEFVNPVIVLCVCAVLVQGIRLKPKEFFTPGSVYAALFLPLILSLLFSDCLSSPQPDIAGAAIAVLVTWHLREIIFDQEAVAGTDQGAFLRCLMAGSLVVMLKLSYAMFGLAAAGVVTLIVLFRQRRLTSIWRPALVVLLLSIPWVCCGYITSGYPFYPMDVGAIQFDWMVPARAALSDRNWILSWAREPYQDWHTVLASSDWFLPWVATTISDLFVRKSLLFFAAGLFLALISRPWRWRKQRFYLWCWLIVPTIVSLVFWFLTAPAPRFAEATIWTAAADVVFLPFTCLDTVRPSLRVLYSILIAGLIALELRWGFIQLVKEHEEFPNFVGAPRQLVPRLTFSGLTVWVPVEGDVTGAWQIPAVPPSSFNPRLEQRGKTFRDGFRVNPAARAPSK